MKNAERITERLRRGFASLDGPERAAGEDCPSAERIWDGVHGRLTPEETKEIALHFAECTPCAADWRLAMRSTERATVDAQPIQHRRPSLRWVMAGAAAATLLFAGLFAVFQDADRFRSTGTEYRTGDGEAIHSLVPDGEVLPREEALLRWTAVGEDARYSVEVGRQDLTTLASAYDLVETEYRIPPAALETVEPGGIVAWQVEAMLPDGRRIVSKAFLMKIE